MSFLTLKIFGIKKRALKTDALGQRRENRSMKLELYTANHREVQLPELFSLGLSFEVFDNHELTMLYFIF